MKIVDNNDMDDILTRRGNRDAVRIVVWTQYLCVTCRNSHFWNAIHVRVNILLLQFLSDFFSLSIKIPVAYRFFTNLFVEFLVFSAQQRIFKGFCSKNVYSLIDFSPWSHIEVIMCCKKIFNR